MRFSTVVGIGALVPTVLSGLLGTLAARPHAAARIFGPVDRATVHPDDFCLESVDVEYQSGSRAWWIPADKAKGAVVIVHGFEPSDDPRSTDPGPRLEVAAFLADHRYSSLVIDLGYASGAHLHSGGRLEAGDIDQAVQWAAAASDLPVAVIGFSAGGHASVVAASGVGTDRVRPFAVITDSAFVDFYDVVRDQGAALLRVPGFVFGLTRLVMRIQTGEWPVDLATAHAAKGLPMLHIHGDADTAIGAGNLDQLASITGGERHLFRDADHVASYVTDPARYQSVVLNFLEVALSSSDR